MDIKKGQVTRFFMVIPECPYPPFKRDFLTKMRAYTHFDQTKISMTNQKGEALYLLTLSLVDEYKLFVPPPNQRDNRNLR